MLGKLLKHEFRATARVMLPLYLVLLAISLCGNFATRVMEHSSSQLLNLVGSLTIFAFFIGLIAVSLMSLYLMISRFHKNLLTDEGYLMFTLPVSVHGLIVSKIIVSTVWFILTGVVDVLSFDLTEILLETDQGMLMIRGSDLHVNRLTLEKGEVDVEGKIDSLTYSDSVAKPTGTSILSRLFG